MRVLVACEESGRVRDAFIARGHDAISCDIQPTSSPGPHYQGAVTDILTDGFDLMIARPPCTFLCLSGARWFGDPRYPNREQDMQDAIDFFLLLQNAPIEKIAIENSQPLGRVMDQVGRYDQKIQPWMFGDPYTKGACLWLKNLNPLVATHEKPRVIEAECHHQAPGPERAKLRSKTYPAVARAFAEQWGTDWKPPIKLESAA